MAEALKKFGKFFLLDMIAQGGMAEIYRARMATLDGGGRLLAVKRIIGNYSENKEFVDMFKSEIKTTSGFTHPNIVQLYDYGEENGMLYIAMELVDGKNLRQFISRFADLKQVFPVEVSVFIMEQAAHGMAYAHGYKDKISNKSLSIVHRDISPQNLLISYDGAVKVIDFGIAKASTNNEATRAGVIKGKPSYLSPEQISGEVLDGRSDIFALGIVLWELLTGKKLFASDNDYGVLKLIENCQNHVKPPSMFNPKIPKELDAIVMKTLHKNRDQRYQTCEEMQRALHKFLYQFAPEFNPADLAYYARDLFKNEIVEDRKRLLKLNEKVEAMLANPTPEPLKVPKVPEAPAATPPAPPRATENDTITLNKPDEESSAQRNTGSFRTVDFKEKTNVTLDFGPGGKPAGSRIGATGIPGASGKMVYATSSTNPRLTNTRSNAGTGTGLKKRPEEKSKTGLVAALVALVLAGAYAGGFLDSYLGGSSKPAGARAQPTMGAVMIDANVKTATITVNGKEVANALPAALKLPVNEPLSIKVSSNGYNSQMKVVTLKDGQPNSLSFELVMESGSQQAGAAAPMVAGEARPVTMRVSVNPPGPGTMMRVNGSVIDTSGLVQITTGRPVELIVEREGFRTVRQVFTVDAAHLAGKAEWTQEVTLVAAKFGFLSIKTTPSGEAIISVDGLEEKWPIPVSRKRLPVGTYKVRLVNSLLGMEKTVDFTVNEDRFTNIEERLSVSADPARAPGSQ